MADFFRSCHDCDREEQECMAGNRVHGLFSLETVSRVGIDPRKDNSDEQQHSSCNEQRFARNPFAQYNQHQTTRTAEHDLRHEAANAGRSKFLRFEGSIIVL